MFECNNIHVASLDEFQHLLLSIQSENKQPHATNYLQLGFIDYL